MSETRNLLEETANKVFEECVTQDVRDAAEEGTWQQSAWEAVETSGLTRAFAEEEAVAWEDAYVLFRAAGAHRVPLPFSETLIAGWLLKSAGLDVPEGPLTIAIANDAEAALSRVPWGRDAAFVVAARDQQVQLFEKSQITATPGQNMTREPRDELTVSGSPLADKGLESAANVAHHLGALARSAQIAGALGWVLNTSVEYANDRVQFGRALGKFQAIQQQLAVLSTEAAAADYATMVAFTAMGEALPETRIAIAKVRAGEAAGKAASIAHQVHGAIGFTREHALHTATRRLWSWRAEFGAERDWADRLGRAALAQGSEQLWPTLARV